MVCQGDAGNDKNFSFRRLCGSRIIHADPSTGGTWRAERDYPMSKFLRWLAGLAVGTCGFAAGAVLGAGFVITILPIGPTYQQAVRHSPALFAGMAEDWPWLGGFADSLAGALDVVPGPTAVPHDATPGGASRPDNPAATAPSDPGAGWDTGLTPGDGLPFVQQAIRAHLPAALEATVEVRWEDRNAQALHVGTGVIISGDGLILSAGHVIGEPGRTFSITMHDGSTRRAESLGLSLYSDAGILRMTGDGPFPHVTVATMDEQCRKNDWCFALGHPGGLDAERGTVVRLGRVIDTDAFTIQSSCLLVGGDSGGPLFDLGGRLVGIHSRISPDSEGNFHVLAAAFHRRWDALLASRVLGEPGGWLGVSFDRTTEVAEAPLTVVNVVSGSAASLAGIRPGDRFTHVSGEPVRSFAEFKGFIAELSPSETVSLTLERMGEPLTIQVTLGEDPES